MPDMVEILADPAPLEFDEDGALITEDGPLDVIDRYSRLVPVAAPAPLPWHVVIDGPSVQIDGGYRQSWEQRPMQEYEIVVAVKSSVQAMLDATATARGYGGDGMSPTLSIATYSDDPNPYFAADAATFKKFRSAVWVQLYATLSAVKAGDREMPESLAALMAELPAIAWDGV